MTVWHLPLTTLECIMFGLGQKVLTLLAWYKFLPILATQETLTFFHGNEAKKKKIKKIKKNFKMADSKKLRFSKPTIQLVLGFGLGLIDAKAIDVAHLIWLRDCPTYKDVFKTCVWEGKIHGVETLARDPLPRIPITVICALKRRLISAWFVLCSAEYVEEWLRPFLS